jgi:glyoxylase-like metal-dependent hydrolase (beta-lactamase superfamily II)
MVSEISPSVLRFDDTCHVYVIRTGSEAVLVDCGCGAVLDQLSALGISRVTDVLLTHHHRDQAQGLPRAIAAGARVWVPQAERDLFARAGEHWQAREIYVNYNMRQDRFTLLESVPIAGMLNDYATYTFGSRTFQVIPTPGHTTGSITLLAEIDGRRMAFSGDLIAAPGKVWSLAATQWTYNGAEGVAASVPSLLDLRDRAPDLLLPAHGETMANASAAIDALVERLGQLLAQRQQNPRLFQFIQTPYMTLTPHLLRNQTSLAYSHVLVSNSGKGLLLDYGYDFVTGIPAGTDRASRRPWLYSLPALSRDHGVHTLSAAVPTHYHDDHVAGLNLLRVQYGAQVWAPANFADILERPHAYDLPCLWFDPISVDRVLPLETPIRWEEYVLTLHGLPGHTLYAVAIELEVDGKHVLVTGDQYQGESGDQWNYVYQNGFRPGDYALSAALYHRLQPDLILSGHWPPLWVEPGYFERLRASGEVLLRLHRELLLVDDVDHAAEGLGARIYPYQAAARAGERFDLTVEVHNPCGRAVTGTLSMAVPAGWQVEPGQADLVLDVQGQQVVTFRLIAAGGRQRRVRVAADLTLDGRRYGQVAEALISVWASE